MNLNFKLFLEMPHIAVRSQGFRTVFTYDGKTVKYLDMKFETYPPGAPERKLYNAHPFYGKIPGQTKFLVFDDFKNCYVSEKEPMGNHLKIRDDWCDFAVFLYMDGSIKEPKHTGENELNINSI
jgi:hypothetical protein